MDNESWCRDDICHWCGNTYRRMISDRRHRFCSHACKQAHHRAYKKYVTTKKYRSSGAQTLEVTRKKRKKMGK